jgi:ATP-binding cassette subfamily C (CFTR/MRP) protein 1
LQTDFSQLRDSDETLVGSKGIALSGGQKQRVVSFKSMLYSRTWKAHSYRQVRLLYGSLAKLLQSIARAIYSRPDIAVFDDMFNGLDKKTAATVFTRVFSKHEGLLATWHTTVVFGTHAGICLDVRIQHNC